MLQHLEKRKKPRTRRSVGRPRKFTEQDAIWLRAQLQKGPKAHGYSYEYWTVLGVRRLLADKGNKSFSLAGSWRILKRIGHQFDDQPIIKKRLPRKKKRNAGPKKSLTLSSGFPTLGLLVI